ncbi:pathogenesis-related leaf protein 6-like [Brassica napus]|uniref:Pathogenesis-related protein 1 n=1 Tax=Brassica campestris TaxID=3711 RepID=M4DQN7_BRACM|nr:pathogenesis-related leaf protein 6-like [Brassica napus]
MSTFTTTSVLIVAISILIIASSVQSTEQQDYLNTHNAARSQVGVPNIVWNATIASYALNYANARRSDCNLVYSAGPYRENLAKGSSSTFSAISAVNLWVAEKPYYNYSTNSCTGGKHCFHYTQVVWRDSVKLGCARVQCTNGWWFVICNYDTPGNYIGQYPY